MDKVYYVYRHYVGDYTFYIGAAMGNPYRAYSKKKRSKEWLEFVEKINFNYEIEILETCKSRKEVAKRESFWIHYYHDLGQAEISKEDFRGKRHHMYGRRGKLSPLYGRKNSEETKKKRSNSLKGKTNGAKAIIVFKDDKFYKEYNSTADWAREFGAIKADDSIGKAAQALVKGKKVNNIIFKGFTAKRKEKINNG